MTPVVAVHCASKFAIEQGHQKLPYEASIVDARRYFTSNNAVGIIL